MDTVFCHSHPNTFSIEKETLNSFKDKDIVLFFFSFHLLFSPVSLQISTSVRTEKGVLLKKLHRPRVSHHITCLIQGVTAAPPNWCTSPLSSRRNRQNHELHCHSRQQQRRSHQCCFTVRTHLQQDCAATGTHTVKW